MDPRKKNRPTPNRKAAFLRVLSETGNVTRAARETGLSRSTAMRHRAKDPAFAEAWAEALDVGADALEAEARRRAVEGVERPVFGRVATGLDGQVGVVREYSDTLLIFLLKGCRPEKYRERREISATTHGKITVDYVNDWRAEAVPAVLGTPPLVGISDDEKN